jgi:hypothetical protein
MPKMAVDSQFTAFLFDLPLGLYVSAYRRLGKIRL